MKKVIIVFCIWFHALCSLAQKDVFTVPTSEIVKQGKLFFQGAGNLSDRVNIDAVFTYGFENNFEGGISIMNSNFNFSSPFYQISPEEPGENTFFLINAQKGLLMREHFKFTGGLRTGTHLAETGSRMRIVNFNYLNSQIIIPDTEIKFLLNLFYSNRIYAGDISTGGFMVATVVPLLKDKINFQAEYVSGPVQFSATTAGFAFQLRNNIEIEAGIFLPNNPELPWGFTLQFNSR
jgi:hypothetical protein